MKLSKIVLILILVVFVPFNSAFAGEKNKVKKRYKKDEVLIKFKASVKKDASKAFNKKFKLSKIKSFKQVGLHHMKLPKGTNVEAVIQTLLKDPDVEYAEPNYIYTIDFTPDDTYFDQLWGLHNTGQGVNNTYGRLDADIDALEAWEKVTDAGNVIVAVVDSGVDHNHPDLGPNIWINTDEIPGNGIDDDANGKIDDVRGWDYVTNDNDPMDQNGHGTHVAGTIGAVGNNGFGVTGVAWNTQIMIVRGLNAGGRGKTDELIEAIQYAKDNGADVINLSWGGGDYSQALKDTIDNSNALVVCSAGNDSVDTDNEPHYPSSYSSANIISVAATDQDDRLASLSNYGVSSVDIGAPGVNIYSTLPSRKTIFEDNFDDENLDGWTSGGTNNTWGVSSSNYKSSLYSLSDSPFANYSNGTYSWIQTQPFNLISENHINIQFNFKGTVLEDDIHLLEASVNGGDWQEVDYFWGDTDEWIKVAIDVTQFKSTSTRFRFVMWSNGSGTADGVYIDDFKITASSDIYDDNTYAYYNGTSMAAPHVSGAAAMTKAMRPEFDAARIKSTIMDYKYRDLLSSLSGKVYTDSRINLGKIAQAISLKYIAPKEEMSVNSYTTNDQRYPSIAFLPNGYAMAAWVSYYQDGYTGLYGQIFDSGGNKYGSEFRISPYVSNIAFPNVIGLKNNTFAVCYTKSPYIMAQFIDQFGNKMGGEKQLCDLDSDYRSYVIKSCSLNNGGFALVYKANFKAIAHIFDGQGRPIGNEIQISGVYDTEPDICSLKDGNIVIVYASWNGSSQIINGRIYDFRANLIKDDFFISTFSSPKLVSLSNGNFIVTGYTINTNDQTITFSSSGQAVGDKFYIPETDAISDSKNGYFVATGLSLDGSYNGVFANIYTDSGVPIREKFQVNTYSESNQYLPAVAVSKDNTAFIAWSSSGQDGSGYGIFGKFIHILDEDNDGIIDLIEETACSEIGVQDTDGDSISDGIEDSNFNGIFDEGETSPCLTDSDNDSLGDGVEDANQNGIVDSGETNPAKSDSDDDGMPDGYEVVNGLDPLNNDAFLDNDSDGYSNLREWLADTSPDDNLSIPDLFADFEPDFDSDAQDLLKLIEELVRVDCLPADPCLTDLNQDGVVDNQDVRLFVEDFGRRK